MLGCLEEERKSRVDVGKIHCVTYIKLSKYKILLLFHSSRQRGRQDTESEGRRRGLGRASRECEMRH